MGLRVSDIINNRIKKAKHQSDRAWIKGDFDTLARADANQNCLKALKKELLKKKLILY
jgi:hypothetical protein